MARIYIIDSIPMIRLGIRSTLEASGHIVVGEGAPGDVRLHDVIGWRRPDVVVIDADGESVRRLHQSMPRVPLVVYRSGAVQVVPASLMLQKDAGPDELLAAIDEATGKARCGASAPHARLSPREREVLALVLEGKRPKEIAHRLDLSNKTVSTHRFRIMKKLGVDGDIELMRYAIRERLTGDSGAQPQRLEMTGS